jgi:hypothetical protein
MKKSAVRPSRSTRPNTAVFGARLTLPIGGTLSVEGAFGYAKSDVTLRITNSCNNGVNTFDCSTNFKGNVITGSGGSCSVPVAPNIWAILGGSYIKHGGKAWDDPSTQETGDIGGVVGFGMRAVITSRLALNLTARSYHLQVRSGRRRFAVRQQDPDGPDVLGRLCRSRYRTKEIEGIDGIEGIVGLKGF